MPLLIDGYNLLSAVGILARHVGPGSLQRARLALLNFLAESLDPGEIPQTTVVFDASDAPPDLPHTLTHRGLTVRFATQYEEADQLIEELIRTHSAPRRLCVVSSDHRLQRAARRRKAQPIDSDVWYARVVDQRRQRRQPTPPPSGRPDVPLLADDVDYWICQFGGPSLLADLLEEQPADQPAADGPPGEPSAPDKPTPDEAAQIGNPFPPGYAEDLLQDDSDNPPTPPHP